MLASPPVQAGADRPAHLGAVLPVMDCAALAGLNWIMDADGGHNRAITDTLWEDGMPLYIPHS